MVTPITYAKQTAFDIAIQEYGGFEGAFQVMQDNPALFPSLDKEAAAGKPIKLTGLPINQDVLKYFKDNNLHPVSMTPSIISTSSSFTTEFTTEFSD